MRVERSVRLDLTMHHYNKPGHDEYYAGRMKATLPNQSVSFEVEVYNPDDEKLLEVVIRKEGFQVVKIQPGSEVHFDDGAPGGIVVFAVFARLIFSAIAQIKLQEGLVSWANVTQGIRALADVEPLHHLSFTETVEWLYSDRRGFEHFTQAVLAEYCKH